MFIQKLILNKALLSSCFQFRSVVSENVVAVKWAWWTFLGLRFGRLHDSTLVVALAVANLFMALLQL